MSRDADEERDESGRFEIPNEAPDRPLGRLVSAQLSAFENQPKLDFRLRLTLGFGETDVEGLGVRYRVRLRQCIVDLETTNCDADYASAYSHDVSHDVASDSVRTTSEASSNINIGADGEYKSGFGNLTAGFSLARKRGTTRERQINRKFSLISCNGDHWVIGDTELGDPEKLDGCLTGRYFHEHPDKPLCAVKVHPEAELAEVTIKITARFGHFFVEVDRAGRSPKVARESEAVAISDAIKARLRGLTLAKAVVENSNRPGVRLPDREFVLLTRTLRAKMPQGSARVSSTELVATESSKSLINQKMPRERP